MEGVVEQTPSHSRQFDQLAIVGFQMIKRLVDGSESVLGDVRMDQTACLGHGPLTHLLRKRI